jgi:hypothetical protein
MKYTIGECVTLRTGFALNAVVPAGSLGCRSSIPSSDASIILFFVRIPVAECDIEGPGPWPDPCTRSYELPAMISIVVTANCKTRVVDIIDDAYILEAEVPLFTYES